MSKKNRLIIIEGPQGTGKTTLANYLRENIPSSNLYRLSGQSDKTLEGKEKSRIMYEALLTYLKSMQEIPMDLIFDRTFFTEEIYSRLGYKEYDFSDVYQNLVQQLMELDYEMYLCLLYLEDTKLYEKRLMRESHHNYQSFSIKNSIDQQIAYLKMGQELKNNLIKVMPIAMDDFDQAYLKINRTFSLKQK